MTVLNYFITVTSSATPISQDSSVTPSAPDPRLTKIILPKKKQMKWSTGVAPGDYGGPPTTTKLRKYWGGEEEDPLTSDEFIWNKDFMGRMKRLIQDSDSDASAQTAPVKEEPSGFLSLNRVMSLDSMEVDLSKELTTPIKRELDLQVEPTAQSEGSTATRWKPAPTRREQEKWERATKAATGGSDVMFREIRRPRGDPEVLAAQSREQYFKLKNKLQILTLGIGGVGLASAYVSYSPEIAARQTLPLNEDFVVAIEQLATGYDFFGLHLKLTIGAKKSRKITNRCFWSDGLVELRNVENRVDLCSGRKIQLVGNCSHSLPHAEWTVETGAELFIRPTDQRA
ncbi:hypothetical protein L484_004817 [Morus notabilis]|uniref:CGL160/ATPI domain-containing protein n=1 Tax=Morus notabilis TaxID=981085 RepID=W9RKC2_9ROSA|nr:hypothetical protein L484_004817 [Morus notabilis]